MYILQQPIIIDHMLRVLVNTCFVHTCYICIVDCSVWKVWTKISSGPRKTVKEPIFNTLTGSGTHLPHDKELIEAKNLPIPRLNSQYKIIGIYTQAISNIIMHRSCIYQEWKGRNSTLVSMPKTMHGIYRIAGNFRGAKYLWFLWLEVWPRIFYPRMKRPCLQCKQLPRKYYPRNVSIIILLNHEYFVPQKLPAIR